MARVVELGGDGPIQSLEVTGDSVPVPDARLLFEGSFARLGHDLVITGQDGAKMLVRDYFHGDSPPALVAPTGARLDGDTVTLLAGPQFPAQYAQATPPDGAEAVGAVQSLTGSATAQRADGSVVELQEGDPVFQGDVLETADGADLAVRFVDDTLFHLQPATRMVVNEVVYNPQGSDNSGLLTVLQGSFSMIAGQIAPTGDLQVGTPIATMGIRGTAVVGLNVDGNGYLALVVDHQDHVGVVGFYDNATGELITTVNSVTVKISLVDGQIVMQPLTAEEMALHQALTDALHALYAQQDGPEGPPDPHIIPQRGPRTDDPEFFDIDIDADTLPDLQELLQELEGDLPDDLTQILQQLAQGLPEQTLEVPPDPQPDPEPETPFTPTINAPETIRYWAKASGEDGVKTVINRISFQDGNGDGEVTVTIKSSYGNDVFTPTNHQENGVRVVSNTDGAIVLTGTITAINAWIAGNNLEWKPEFELFGVDLDFISQLFDRTLRVEIEDDTGLTAAQDVGLESFVPFLPGFFIGNSVNHFDDTNFWGITTEPHGGLSIWTNEMTTSYVHLGSDGVTYDGGGHITFFGHHGPDTINLVFTGEQLVEILTDTTGTYETENGPEFGWQDALREYLASDGESSSTTLDLSETAWNASAQGFLFKSISLANGYGTGIVDMNDYLKDLPALPQNGAYHDVEAVSFDTETDGLDIEGTGVLLIDLDGGQDLVGGKGDDVLVAHEEGSTLFGGKGDDLLLGGAGDDILDGGAGQNVLFGGAGADTFRIWSDDVVDYPDLADIVLDYSFVEGDLIDLTGLLNAVYDGNGSIDNVQLAQNDNDVFIQIGAPVEGSDWTDVAILSGYGTSGQDPVKIAIGGDHYTLTADTLATEQVEQVVA